MRAIYRLGPIEGQLLGCLGVFLIFLPKMNLISLQAEAAGLRIDDVLLLGCQTIFFFFFLYSPGAKFRRIELIYAAWVGIMLLSNVVNKVFYGRSNPLYTVRFAEYFIFFYSGYYFAKRYSLVNLAKAVLWINAPIMILQSLSLMGGFESAGYTPDLVRPVGLTGGGWEIGVLINFCFAIIVFEKETSVRSSVLTFLITTGMLVLAASRMSMLANIVVMFGFYAYKGHRLFPLMLKGGLITAVVGCFLFLVPNPLQARSENLFSMRNIDYLEQVYNHLQDHPPIEGMYDIELGGDDDSDMSWVMRAGKWCIAVKIWTEDAVSVLFGAGPGAFGAALDGGWVRIVTETGLIGFAGFLLTVRSFWKISPTIRMMLIIMGVNMLMIDIYMAYKVAAFLLFTTGAIMGKSSLSRDTESRQHERRLKRSRLQRELVSSLSYQQ